MPLAQSYQKERERKEHSFNCSPRMSKPVLCFRSSGHFRLPALPAAIFFLVLLALTPLMAAAWTATPATPITALRPRTIRHCNLLYARRATRTKLSVDDDTDGEECSPSLFASVPSSRRQWLVNSAASGIALLLPSSAARAATRVALVSTAATCDPTVSVWKRGDRIVYLLGSAHISTVSANLAGQLVRDVHPDAVFIELDLKRVGGLKAPPALPYSNEPIGPGDNAAPAKRSRLLVPAISSSAVAVAVAGPTVTAASGALPMVEGTAITGRGDPVGYGAAAIGNAVRGMYKNLDKQGFKPGQEFLLAVREGQAIGADIVLGDRDVEVTLRRLSQAVAATDLKKLMDPNNELEQSLRELMPAGSGGSVGMGESAEDLSTFVETIKTRDRVRKIMGQLKELAPALVEAMLWPRDWTRSTSTPSSWLSWASPTWMASRRM